MKSVGEVLYNLGTLLYAIVATHYITLPWYECIQSGMRSDQSQLNIIFAQFQRLTGYDVYSNHVFNKWMLSGICGYVSMGLLCGVLDLILPPSQKTQASRSYFSSREWTHAVALSLFNLLVSSWVVMLPVHHFMKSYPVPESNPIHIPTELMKFFLCFIIVETWFYITHYALHMPVFYSRIHKIHHRFKAPVAVASMYAHPVEFILGNLLGVVFGPLLTQCHPITSYIWICNALIATGGSHSGYKMFFAEFHDQHHEYFDCNYGVSK